MLIQVKSPQHICTCSKNSRNMCTPDVRLSDRYLYIHLCASVFIYTTLNSMEASRADACAAAALMYPKRIRPMSAGFTWTHRRKREERRRKSFTGRKDAAPRGLKLQIPEGQMNPKEFQSPNTAIPVFFFKSEQLLFSHLTPLQVQIIEG